MSIRLRSFVAVVIPVLTMTSIGCSSLGRGNCTSCSANQAYPAPYIESQGTGGSAPLYSPAPIPVPPSELEGNPVVVPPPPVSARPNAIQTMRGATTNFFHAANENLRNTFQR